jgi:two-component system LytT family response regulator
MKCIILDDEPLAIDVLQDYVRKLPLLQWGGSFRDPVEALTFLKTHPIDLIFLDMNMPGLNGIQFLKSLRTKPLVIFTTAYSQYAVESYEHDAVDYLLKPIEFDRFCRAVAKAQEIRELKSKTKEAEQKKTILIKSGTGYRNLHFDEILFLKGTGNYVTFVLPQRKVLSLLSMKQACKILPGERFVRIHKSFIVNVERIEFIEKERVKIGEHFLPMGESYRSAFLNTMKERNVS